MSKTPDEVRFFDRIMPEPNSGCWLWTGELHHTGYGILRYGRKSRRATHVSLALIGIEVPAGLMALHRCDNPPCVNPAHLFVGDHRANALDAKQKNRLILDGLKLGRGPHRRWPKGPQWWNKRRLTDEQATIIRKSSDRPADMARLYGVSVWTIYNIRQGRRYCS